MASNELLEDFLDDLEEVHKKENFIFSTEPSESTKFYDELTNLILRKGKEVLIDGGDLAGRDNNSSEVISRLCDLIPEITKAVVDIRRFLTSQVACMMSQLSPLIDILKNSNSQSFFKSIKCILFEAKNVEDLKDRLHAFLPRDIVLAILMGVGDIQEILISSQTANNDHDSMNSIVCRCIDMVESVEGLRREIDSFLQVEMNEMAPNMTALLGSAVTARLIGAAGGLNKIALMPSQKIEKLGGLIEGKAASSNVHGKRRAGGEASEVYIIGSCDIIESIKMQSMVDKDEVLKKAMRLITNKAALAARADCFGSGDDREGKKLREFVEESIRRAMEPPPAREIKALPIPEDKPRPRRGGKRLRRMKEKYGLSEFRKENNRIKFGAGIEEDNRDDSKNINTKLMKRKAKMTGVSHRGETMARSIFSSGGVLNIPKPPSSSSPDVPYESTKRRRIIL